MIEEMNYETISQRLTDMFTIEEMLEALDITPEALLRCLHQGGLIDETILKELSVL